MKNTSPKSASRLHHAKSGLLLPPGTRLSDIYMDAAQVAQELNLSKRTVRNMRVSGKLSWTTLFGKVFYLRQEIAELMIANKMLKKIKR